MRIYVASSWRNVIQPTVVQRLRDDGHIVYDFKKPFPGYDDFDGFSWSQVDPDWESWTPEQFRTALQHPIAKAGFATDMNHLKGADATVLVTPCGRSAHLELGYAIGQRQTTIIYQTENQEPELMYAMAHHICFDLGTISRLLMLKELDLANGR